LLLSGLTSEEEGLTIIVVEVDIHGNEISTAKKIWKGLFFFFFFSFFFHI